MKDIDKNRLATTSHIAKNEQPIATIEDWEKLASPAGGSSQWVDGRSAKECARHWTSYIVKGRALPGDILTTLFSEGDLGHVYAWTAEPEAKQSFDDAGGNTRNCDLEVQGCSKAGKFLLSIEAKADESFGKTLTEQRLEAEATLAEKPKSQQLSRRNELEKRLLSDTTFSPNRVYYRLLTATAGAIEKAKRIEARHSILLIHEFVTNRTQANKRMRNHEVLNYFTSLLSGREIDLAENTLIDPIDVAYISKGETPLFYIGLVRTRLEDSGDDN